MKAEEFVRELRRLAPGVDDLRSEGLSDEAIKIERNSYFVKREISDRAICTSLGEIGRLVQGFDVSTLEICIVRFLQCPLRHRSYYEIGIAEADPIVLLCESGEIEVRALEDPEVVLWKCATSGAHFLSALYTLARFYSQPLDKILYDVNDEQRKQLADTAAELAGGTKYTEFYYMLVGVENW